MDDYSEEVKWRRANYLLRRFEGTPSSYGFDLREVLNVPQYNDIQSFKVPDEIELKINFLKNEYWPLARLLLHPLDTRYFINCCYLGKPLADKLLHLAFLSYANTNFTQELSINNTSLSVDESFIHKVNSVCKQYSMYNVSKEYSSLTSKYISQICRNNNLKELEAMWQLRNKAI